MWATGMFAKQHRHEVPTELWSATCVDNKGGRESGCVNATAVAILTSACPHFSLEDAPRTMPIFGMLSASVLMVSIIV